MWGGCLHLDTHTCCKKTFVVGYFTSVIQVNSSLVRIQLDHLSSLQHRDATILSRCQFINRSVVIFMLKEDAVIHHHCYNLKLHKNLGAILNITPYLDNVQSSFTVNNQYGKENVITV